MKLMVLTPAYPPVQNAPGVRMSEMVTTFAEQDEVEHITVLVYRPGPTTEHRRREVRISDKVTVIYYRPRLSGGILHRLLSLTPFTLLRWTALAIREARRASPDVILATIPPRFNPAIAAYLTSLVCRIPFCIDIRDFWPTADARRSYKGRLYSRLLEKLIRRVMTRLFLRACRKALLISNVYEAIGAYLADDCRITTPWIWVPNGVNFAELEQVARGFDRHQVLASNGIPYNADSRLVIHVGKSGDYYRPEALLEPLRRLREKGRNVAYVVVGEIAGRQAVEDMATSLGIDDGVFLVGDRDHSQVLELLTASDAAFYALDNDFANPQYLLGVKVLEYVACKLPILSITGNGSVVSDMVKKHELGIALDWHEVEQIEAALERLFDNSEHYVRNVERYYPAFVEEFDRAANNRRLLEELWTLWQQQWRPSRR